MHLRDLLLDYESSHVKFGKAIDEYSAARGGHNEGFTLRELRAAGRDLEERRKAVQKRVHEYAPQMSDQSFKSLWQE